MPDDLGPTFEEFAAQSGREAPGQDFTDVRSRAQRLRATRWAITAAVVTLLAAPVAAYVLTGRGRQNQAVAPLAPATSTMTGGPAPDVSAILSPTPTGSALAAGLATPTAIAVNAVDWTNSTLDIPANQTGCAAGTAQFQGGLAEVGGTTYRLGDTSTPQVRTAYGDVDADGTAEALLLISCATPDGRKNPPALVLLVSGEPTVHTLGVAFSSSPRLADGEGKSRIGALAVRGNGQITFEVRTFEGNGQCEYQLRWTGTGLNGACNP